MAASDSLGDLTVNITGDFSELSEAIGEATSAAEAGASQIADAFDNSDVGEVIELAMQQIASSAQAAGSAVADASVQASSELGGVAAASDVAETAASSLSGELVNVAASASEASSGLSGVASSEGEAAEGAEEADGVFGKLGETLLALTGLELTAQGLQDIASEALESYGAVQKSTIALTALTGSASGAAETIENLKGLALGDALSFPSLVTAQQRMTAFGFSAAQIPSVLQAAADAAAATGNEFDQVTASISRMGLSGTAGAQRLAQLGISTQDLAASLGVSADEVAAAFKAMDPSDRITAIIGALQKYQGTAEQVAQGIAGQWQNLKTEADLTFEEIGNDIAPAAGALLKLSDTALDVSKQFFSSFGDMEKSVGDLAQAILNLPGPPPNFAAFLKLLGQNVAQQQTAAFSLFGIAAESAANDIKELTNSYPEMATAAQANIAKANASIQSQLQQLQALGTAYISNSAGLKALETQQKAANDAVSAAGAVLAEAKQALDKGTISQGTYNLALKDYDSAVLAANPHTADFKDSVAGLTQAAQLAQEKFQSSVTVLQQLEKQSDGSSKALALVAQGYSTAESAAKKAGQAFADSAGELAKIQLSSAQNQATLTALDGALTAMFRQLSEGNLTAEQQEAIQEQIITTYGKAQVLAVSLGQTYYNASAAMMTLTASAVKQQNALNQVATTYTTLTSNGQKTIANQEAVDAAFKSVQTDATALGLAVTKVGTGLQFTATGASAANPQMKELATQLTNAYSNGVQFVTVNGKMVPLLGDLATQSMNAAIQSGKLAATIPSVTTSAADAGVVIREFGEDLADTGGSFDTTGIKVIQLTGGMSQMSPAITAVQQALNSLNNTLPATAADVERLTASATNQVASAQAMVQAWVNLNSTQQTTVQGQLAVQSAFAQSKSALAALGIQLSATGATTNSSSTAVQNLVTQINAAITAMNQTPGAAANAAAGIAAIGNAAATATAQVDALDQAINKLSDALDAGTGNGGSLSTGAIQGATSEGAGLAFNQINTGLSQSQAEALAAYIGGAAQAIQNASGAWIVSMTGSTTAATDNAAAVSESTSVTTAATAAITDSTTATTTATAATTSAVTAATAAATSLSSIAVTASNVDSAAQGIANQLLNGATSVSYSSDTLNTANKLQTLVQQDLAEAGSNLGSTLSNTSAAASDTSSAVGELTLAAQSAAQALSSTEDTATDAMNQFIRNQQNLAGVYSPGYTSPNTIGSESSGLTMQDALTYALQQAGMGGDSGYASLTNPYATDNAAAIGTEGTTSMQALMEQTLQAAGLSGLYSANADGGISLLPQFGTGQGVPGTNLGTNTDEIAGSGPGAGGLVWSPSADAYVSAYGPTQAQDQGNQAQAMQSMQITFTGNQVIGDAGITQLANLVQQKIITSLRQAGLKV